MEDSSIKSKACTLCGGVFPATREFFTRSEKGRYGLHARCLKCHSADRIRHNKGQPTRLALAREVAYAAFLALPKIDGAERIFLESKTAVWRSALVDESLYPGLRDFRWYFTGGYVTRDICSDGRRKALRLHQSVLGVAPEGMVIDHINGDTLDNRLCNLRFATWGENAQNRGGNLASQKRFKGVFQQGEVYRARIWVEGKGVDVGSSRDEEEAARMYDAAARHYFGEFARVNLPDAEPLPFQGPRTQKKKEVKPPRVTSSRFLGVGWHKGAGKWIASAKLAQQGKYIGLFDDEEAAARARDAFVKEHGIQTKLNFPD